MTDQDTQISVPLTVWIEIERILSPSSVGSCMRCNRPWKVSDCFGGLVGVDGHSTKYSNGSGCFPLCESCWSMLIIGEREPYYRDLVKVWREQAKVDGWVEDYDERERQIIEAVRAGL